MQEELGPCERAWHCCGVFHITGLMPVFVCLAGSRRLSEILGRGQLSGACTESPPPACTKQPALSECTPAAHAGCTRHTKAATTCSVSGDPAEQVEATLRSGRLLSCSRSAPRPQYKLSEGGECACTQVARGFIAAAKLRLPTVAHNRQARSSLAPPKWQLISTPHMTVTVFRARMSSPHPQIAR